MLPDPPEMQNARLEEIDRGQTDAFEFRITGETYEYSPIFWPRGREAGGLGREPGRTSSTCRTCCRFSCSPLPWGSACRGPPRRFWSSRPRVTEKPSPTPCTDCRRRRTARCLLGS